MRNLKILSIEECNDKAYGESIVQYQVDASFVSFAFSSVKVNEALRNPALVSSEIASKDSNFNGPLWLDLSETILDLITESAFDMEFIENDDENWTREMAEAIWLESRNNDLSSVITAGEDSALITVYAGAMGSVNWSSHPTYGKSCLQIDCSGFYKNKQDKPSLSDQIGSASGRSNDLPSEHNLHQKAPER